MVKSLEVKLWRITANPSVILSRWQIRYDLPALDGMNWTHDTSLGCSSSLWRHWFGEKSHEKRYRRTLVVTGGDRDLPRDKARYGLQMDQSEEDAGPQSR